MPAPFTGGRLAGFVASLRSLGAHGSARPAVADMLAVFETGVRYQMYHALALMLTAAIMMIGRDAVPGRALTIAGWSFIGGIVLFSGSLYLLAVTGITILGAVTPLGGVALLLGWACLVIAML